MVRQNEDVKAQYATAKNLSRRISLHDKYSTNKQGFSNWIISHYDIKDGAEVLELGCGTGEMWIGREDLIEKCSRLVLSDFSAGMLETAQRNLSGFPNLKSKIEYKVIDIQEIPYDDNRFDIVIAHMMLYHVPDIPRGISEIRRVLKQGGIFYSATYGENGIMPYVCSLLKEYKIEERLNKRFTLQNGEIFLKAAFDHVEQDLYEDSLAVTDIDDLVAYIYSLTSMIGLQDIPKEDVRNTLKKHMVDGVLCVPKEYGMFISAG